MKKYEIVILKKAAIELRDQEDYIRFEQDDPESADIFIQRFLSALERLEYLPYSCPAMILGKRQRRKLVVGNHIAVFRVDARRLIVFVEHVFHARRDYVKFL